MDEVEGCSVVEFSLVEDDPVESDLLNVVDSKLTFADVVKLGFIVV